MSTCLKPLEKETARKVMETLERLGLSKDLAWLVANWDEDGVIERSEIGLKGPALQEAVIALRALAAAEVLSEFWIKKVIEQLQYLDEAIEKGHVLSGAAVVGVGVLHTSRP